MQRSDFDAYLERFHARDYEAVLAYYADDLEVSFAGYTFRTKDEVRGFYKFFHAYVNETIQYDAHASSGDFMAIEARVLLECYRDLTAEALAGQGLERIVSLPAGAKITIPQFIHYHFRDGKIVKVHCVVSGEPY